MLHRCTLYPYWADCESVTLGCDLSWRAEGELISFFSVSGRVPSDESRIGSHSLRAAGRGDWWLEERSSTLFRFPMARDVSQPQSQGGHLNQGPPPSRSTAQRNRDWPDCNSSIIEKAIYLMKQVLHPVNSLHCYKLTWDLRSSMLDDEACLDVCLQRGYSSSSYRGGPGKNILYISVFDLRCGYFCPRHFENWDGV